MARKFLYVIATLVVLVIAFLFVLRIWSQELSEFTFVPRGEFVAQEPLEETAYEDPAMWFSRPGIGRDDPARWQPAYAEDSGQTEPAPESPPSGSRQPFATFFVHPTSYLERADWNAPLDDTESQKLARTFVKGMASAFNGASEIWAPRYRQATFGAFLTDKPESQKSLQAAYQDVAQAFDFFLSSIDADIPIVLAGHSQGSLHLMHLIERRVAGTPLEQRIAAAYLVGWPISATHDLPRLNLPACADARQAGCIMSWSSFAEPAEPQAVLQTYATSRGLDGEWRGESPIVCTNPLTGTLDDTASRELNRGTLVPEEDLEGGMLVPNLVPARCDERGLLLIGPPPELGPYALPGNNYHVYDIPLFWANLQADVARRVEAWTQAH